MNNKIKNENRSFDWINDYLRRGWNICRICYTYLLLFVPTSIQNQTYLHLSKLNDYRRTKNMILSMCVGTSFVFFTIIYLLDSNEFFSTSILFIHMYLFRYHMREQEVLMQLQLIKECVYHKHVRDNLKRVVYGLFVLFFK